MISTQLYSLLKKLDPETQTDFGNWLQWRLRGKEQYLQVLYEGLLGNPKWTSIWQDMFPQKPLPEDKKQIPHILRKRAHALKKLLKEYLAYQYILDDHYFLDISFLKHVNAGKVNEDFMVFFRQLERAYTQKDGAYHEQMGLMLEEFYAYESRMGKKVLGSRWQEMIEHFAISYRFRFLELYLSTTNNRHLPKSIEKPQDFTLDELRKDRLVNENSALKLLLEICRLTDTDIKKSPEEHLEVIEVYKENYHHFEAYMQQNMSICIENYLNRRVIKEGLKVDGVHRFNYYVWAAGEGLYLYEGILNYKRYVSIVFAGIEAEKLEQTKEFMAVFTSKLDPKVREDVYRFCEGLCLFEEGDFDPILKGFMTISFPIPAYETNGRLLHLQARYEKGERAELEVPLKSLRTFLKRNPALSEGFKQQSKLKIKLFLDLLTHFRRAKVLKMKAEALNIKNASFRKWMLAKIEQRLKGDEFLPPPV
ncbi:MAG: hypothetical protein AAF927_02560 [Bacteroidota bacterium]